MITTLALAALVAGSVPPAAPDRVSAVGLHYRLEGSGPDIVLIHGFHTDMREWDDVAAGLTSTHRVLRYDVRGHGRSTIPATLPPSTDDVLALLDELQIARATIVGLSMGATIALDFALTHPTRVDRLVLLSPGIPGVDVQPRLDWMKPIIDAVREGNPRRAAGLWWDGPILDGVPRTGARADRFRTIILDNASVWTVKSRPPALDPPAGKRLSDVSAPVLVVTGDIDTTGAQENGRRVVDGLRRGRLHSIAGAGHMISMQRPDDVIRLVEAFSHEPGSRSGHAIRISAGASTLERHRHADALSADYSFRHRVSHCGMAARAALARPDPAHGRRAERPRPWLCRADPAARLAPRVGTQRRVAAAGGGSDPG
jgi:pimeloyl-ACP methyl ester carboxylesterase